MNVKISYTIPFDRIPSKVDELLMESGRNLEGLGSRLRPNSFDEEPTVVMYKLDLIEKTRKELASIDFLLEDCYSILAGYNKALADMKMPKQQEQIRERMADEGGSSSNPTKSTDGKT